MALRFVPLGAMKKRVGSDGIAAPTHVSTRSAAHRDAHLLGQLNRGIEKESLRVLPDGNLSQAPHPAALGSALTHPLITTDFCESQPELITGVHTSVEALPRRA